MLLLAAMDGTDTAMGDVPWPCTIRLPLAGWLVQCWMDPFISAPCLHTRPARLPAACLFHIHTSLTLSARSGSGQVSLLHVFSFLFLGDIFSFSFLLLVLGGVASCSELKGKEVKC